MSEANEDGKYEEWQMLVHVFKKWRHVVFQFPLRLNLRILCLGGTPVKEKLDHWPPFPIIIDQFGPATSKSAGSKPRQTPPRRGLPLLEICCPPQDFSLPKVTQPQYVNSRIALQYGVSDLFPAALW